MMADDFGSHQDLMVDVGPLHSITYDWGGVKGRFSARKNSERGILPLMADMKPPAA
jgi:hypothetical protein